MNLFGNAVPWRSIAKEALERTAIVARFLCLLHVTNTYICTPTLVCGPSMLPTLNLTGDVLLAERVSHRLGKVGPGDVVLVKSPVDPRKTLTKRVVAMGGDKVTFVVDPRNSDRVRTITVPKGHVWIQGDNIYASHDSRRFGAVPYGLVEGKILCRCIAVFIGTSVVRIKRTPCSPLQQLAQGEGLQRNKVCKLKVRNRGVTNSFGESEKTLR